MAPPVADSLDLLRRRARRVLARYSNGDLKPILKDLARFGEIGIFGGLLRDSALNVPTRFRSDIDLVVVVDDEVRFDRYFRDRDSRLNRFGGYRLGLALGGSIDVWPLHRTWAFQRGILRGSCLRDLIETTYFSWDAIVYSWTAQRLYCREDYLENIQHGLVDIVLRENPNPVGALVRTMRLLVSGRAGIRWRLARHTCELLKRHEIKEVVLSERRGFRNCCLDEQRVRHVGELLNRFVLKLNEGSAFRLPPREQLSLPLPKLSLSEAAASPAGGPMA